MTNQDKIQLLIENGYSLAQVARACVISPFYTKQILQGTRKGGKFVTKRLDDLTIKFRKDENLPSKKLDNNEA